MTTGVMPVKEEIMNTAFEIAVRESLELLRKFPRITHSDVIEAAERVMDRLYEASGEGNDSQS